MLAPLLPSIFSGLRSACLLRSPPFSPFCLFPSPSPQVFLVLVSDWVSPPSQDLWVWTLHARGDCASGDFCPSLSPRSPSASLPDRHCLGANPGSLAEHEFQNPVHWDLDGVARWLEHQTAHRRAQALVSGLLWPLVGALAGGNQSRCLSQIHVSLSYSALPFTLSERQWRKCPSSCRAQSPGRWFP